MNDVGQIDEDPGQPMGQRGGSNVTRLVSMEALYGTVVGVSTERAVRDRGQNSMNTRLRLTIILNTRITATETSPPAIVP